ncbi:MAG: tRNA guanosine(34) transglycosylase Tgt [Bryobacterales bacterium]|nr:tRNA guanosine(34) transglycosylase Tgt [Bryobacterales bacterium]
MMSLRFEVVAECPHTRARAGVLHTAHGSIETPVFMPVGTYGAVKGLTPKVLAEELGAAIILANTYHLYLRPGHELVRELGGLHGFMSWPNAVLTDSGGFQVFSLEGFRKIREEGVEFQSHLDGSRHTFTPESTVDVQRALGSDVMMVLDECPPYPVEAAYAREAMERTVRWAERAFRHWRSVDTEPQQALFPIVQGAMDRELRRDCARRLLELDAPGYAVGGLSVGEPRPLSYDMVEATEDILPRDRPRYVMGVGMLHELGEYVSRGTDMMDCVLPTRNARNGFFFTPQGKLVIKNARYASDPSPIDPACPCYCCRNFSRAYLRHLFLAQEMLFSTLATIHNVFTYLDTMKRIRQAIVIGNLPGFLDRLRAADAPLV